jgi:O-antigen/teichoic acid export membrane protein
MEGSLIVSVLGSACLILIAKPLLEWWTHGKVPCDYPLLVLLIAATVVNSIWFTASALLQATNKHVEYSLIYCISCAGSVGLSIATIPCFGIMAVPGSMLMVEAVTGIFVIYQSFRIAKASLGDSIKNIFFFKELRSYWIQKSGGCS